METINISESNLEEYYQKYFFGDMDRYFIKETNDDGISGILKHNWQWHSPVQRRKYITPVMAIKGTVLNDPNELPNGDLEQEMYFTSLFSAIYHAEHSLIWIFNRNYKKLEEFMKSLGYPLCWQALNSSKGIDDFLFMVNLSPSIDDRPIFRDTYLKVIELTYPFVFNKISTALRNWDNHYFENNNGYISSPADNFDHSMSDILFEARRKFTPQHSLTGISFNNKNFFDFYEKKYSQLLRKYFIVQESTSSYPKILFVNYRQNERLVDGQPGDNPTENIMFSLARLYQIIGDQSIDSIVEDIDTFHKYVKWPWISTGPGAGNNIHSLIMLEEAGLAPTYEETLFFINAFNTTKTSFADYFYSLMNGAKIHFDNAEISKEFRQTYNGHIRNRIKNKFETLTEQVETILNERIKHPELSWNQLVEKVCGNN